MRIGERQIGSGEPVYIIAEIGVNHDGEVDKALMLTDAAAHAGADAIKLQYFKTDLLMSKAAKLAAYQRAAGEDDPIKMLRRLELNLEEMSRVVDRAHERGIHAIVTVFSTELVEPAMDLAWDAVKSASPDIVHWPLLGALMATGKPMIVSTGASTFLEVQEAYHELLEPIADRLALLQCVSCYPTKPEDAAIAGMLMLEHEVVYEGGCLGYSDHTESIETGALARRIGATLLEKHLTYDRAANGPDHRASLTPAQFREYVRVAGSADTPSLLVESTQEHEGLFDDAPLLDMEVDGSLFGDPQFGPIEKRVLDCERDVRLVSRQSIVTASALAAGHRLTERDVAFKRPGAGIEPREIREVVGRTLARDVEGDVPLVWDDLEE